MAKPSPTKAALRSSAQTFILKCPNRETATDIGALLDPGLMIKSRQPASYKATTI